MPAVARPTAALEKAGIPSTLIVGSVFVHLADFIGNTMGIRDMSLVSFPGTFSLESRATFREKLEQGVLDQIINGLTGPLEEKREAEQAPGPRDVVFTGTLDRVNKYFFESKWTDGLPIIPPTIDRVEEFLKYTDISSDEEVAILPPGSLRCTPWDIAVNGVMAGCRPEFMPVLIAITEAMAGEDFNLRNINTTWGDVPFVVLNGPIIKQLCFEYDQGAISLGPNPAIGRFLGLVLRNMAGYRPGETYMGTWGYYLPFAVAEDEESSPWEPYHVEKGFDRKTSTLTVRGTFNWGPQMSLNDVRSADAALMWLSNYTARIIDVHHPWSFATTHFTMFLTSPTAKMLADAGMSKQDVIKYLWENTTTTVGDFHAKYLDGVIKEKRSIRHFLELGLVDEATIREYEAAEAKGRDELLRVIIRPESIDIIVTGDRGRDKAQWFWTWYNYPVTKEIRLPANWDYLIRDLAWGVTGCSVPYF